MELFILFYWNMQIAWFCFRLFKIELFYKIKGWSVSIIDNKKFPCPKWLWTIVNVSDQFCRFFNGLTHFTCKFRDFSKQFFFRNTLLRISYRQKQKWICKYSNVWHVYSRLNYCPSNSIPNRSSQTYSIQLKTLQTSINVARIDIEISTSLSSSTLFQQIKY